jgi:hypothetical protein
MFPGGVSSSVLFQVPGKFGYICRFHADMKGIVNVQSSQATNITALKLVRKGGFEPPRLSAPPPQDGVSASSTTSALESTTAGVFGGVPKVSKISNKLLMLSDA